MPLSTNAMISELRTNLGVSDTDEGFDDSGCLLLLNLEWWEDIDTFQFREKERTVTFQTVAGTPLYAVPQPFEAVLHVSIEDNNDQSHMTLDYMDRVIYENKFVDNTSEYDKPTNYVREQAAMRLWPTPNDIYNITFKYLITLDDLSTTHNAEIPQIWGAIIVDGATARGYKRLGDLERVQSYFGFRDAAIAKVNPTQSKEETDTRLASLNVRRNDKQ